MIREGHRELVTTFREFASGLDRAEDGALDPETLRGVVAFLRQSLLPFAHWEETQIDGCAEVAEDTAFEHAFLNAEVDALATAVAELARTEGPDRAGIARRIRRQADRIEAVLELHVQKAEDRESSFPEPETASAGDGGEGTGATREMGSAEIHHFLLRNDWGILCTVGAGIPYAVPVSYGFDGRHLYLASGPGRKGRNLEASPAVCLTVVRVEEGDRWRSVVATGKAHPVRDVRGKFHALNSLRRQRAARVAPSATDLARIARASVYRIVPDEISGRARGYDPAELPTDGAGRP